MIASVSHRKVGPIGCAIAARTVRLAQVRTEKPDRLIIQAASAEVAGDHGDDHFPPPEQVAPAIRAALARGTFTGRRAVSSAPAESVQLSTMRLALMPDAEMGPAIHWQASLELGASPADMQAAYFDVGEVADTRGPRREVIAASASIADLEAHTETLRAAGLTVAAIEVEPGALARCFRVRSTAPIFVVDFGLMHSMLLAVRDGLPVLHRCVNIGWNNVIRFAAAHFAISEDQQAVLRRPLARGDFDEVERMMEPFAADGQRAFERACSDVASQLAREIALCVHYLGEILPEFGEPRLGCIVGAGRYERTFFETMVSRCGLEFRALVDVLPPRIVTAVLSITEDGQPDRWLLPIGLALYGCESMIAEEEGDSPKRITLLPERFEHMRARKRRRAAAAALAACASVILLLWAFIAWNQVHALNQRIARAERELAPLRALERARADLRAEHQELTARLMTLESLREPVPTVALLALLTQLAPADIYFRHLTMESPLPGPLGPRPAAGGNTGAASSPAMRIQIQGMATIDSAITQMMRSITERNMFRNVRLDDSRTTVFRDRPCYEFQISMEVGPSPASETQP